MHARPSHSSRFDEPNNINPRIQMSKLLIMQFSPLPCYLVPLRPKYSPQNRILQHPSLRSSLSMSDQVAHPYKTTSKRTVLYLLMLTILDIKMEGKRLCTNDNNYSMTSISPFALLEYNFATLGIFQNILTVPSFRRNKYTGQHTKCIRNQNSLFLFNSTWWNQIWT